MSEWMCVLDNIMEYIINEDDLEDIKLPSEHTLAERFGVSRHNVRKAYDRLTDMGYIYSAQGKGRYIKSKQDKIELALTADISFTDKMRWQGYNLETQNIHFTKLEKAEKIRNTLQLEADDFLYKITRLRIIDNEPAALHCSYVSNKLFPNIEIDGPKITSMFSYYRRHGFTSYFSKGSEITTSLPTQYEREFLNCPALSPILVLESRCYDADSHDILEVSKIIYRGDKFICRFKSE